MSYQKKLIAEAELQELRDFAEIHQGLPVASDAERSDIIAQIRTVSQNDWILVETAELEESGQTQTDQARAEAQIRIRTGDSRDDPKWTIMIGSTELPGGRDPVPVGVNGVVALIQRDQVAEVPHRYVLALNNAVRVSLTHVPGSRGELVPSNVRAYPFETIEKPSKAEIDAWQERTRDKVLA